MARTYATIDAGIWLDPEFCGLGAGAQRTYFMLITQNDISACGSLALTLRRWGATCGEKKLTDWLADLESARFILVDSDTEELLVRTFVKWDGGYKHSKRVMAVIATAKAIRSHRLRTAVLHELARLGVAIDTQSDATTEAIDSRRSVVTLGGNKCTPHSTLQEREPSASKNDAEPPRYCPKHPNGTDTACRPCGTAREAWEAWDASRKAARAEARRAAKTARDECTLCDDAGWRIDPTTREPVGRCDHRGAA